MEATLNYPYKSKIQELILLNSSSFIERSLCGIIVGYTVNKLGSGSGLGVSDHLVTAMMSEITMDNLGYTTFTNQKANRFPRFSIDKTKEAVKDDLGAIAGWTFGYTLGYYLGSYL